MGINEKKLRDEIRKQLEEEEQARQDRKKSESVASGKPLSKEKITRIPQPVKEYIYLNEGWKFFKNHTDILICVNHLGEILFCTPHQIEQQNEYFDEGITGEKLVQKQLRKKPDFDLESPDIKQYSESIQNDFHTAFQTWVEINKKRLEELAVKEEARKRQRIVEEEKEKFYRDHPEYNKYFNHLEEYKWMTEDEYRQQNEYYPPDESFVEKVSRNPLLSFAGIITLIVFAIVLIWFMWPESGTYAYVQINSNVEDFRLMAERTNFLVHEKTQVVKVPLVESIETRVRAFKPGYKTVHGDTILKLSVGDTAKYLVYLRKIEETDKLSRVKLRADINNAKIFVNRSYYGEYPQISTLFLEPGVYEIQLYKDKYRNLTDPQMVDFTSDTTERSLYFNFEHVSKILETRASRIQGSIGISSNVPNADVYVNGQIKGKTNLVLNNLSSGRYNIKVTKKGYSVTPASRIVELGPGREVTTIEFTLMSTSGQLVLDVNPQGAVIFMDGKKLSQGSFQGVIPQGNHTIQPRPLNGYRSPLPIKINLQQNDYKKISIVYSPDIDYQLSLNSNGSVAKSGYIRIVPGYERLGIFREDQSLGPEITNNEAKGFVWMMGYALRFESPPGNDGFIYIINIPIEFDLNFSVYFEWEGYKLRDNYPITPSEGHFLRLMVNGKNVLENYEPKHFIDDSGAKPEKIRINRYLRPGNNRLQFSVTDDNSSYYILKKIRIH